MSTVSPVPTGLTETTAAVQGNAVESSASSATTPDKPYTGVTTPTTAAATAADQKRTPGPSAAVTDDKTTGGSATATDTTKTSNIQELFKVVREHPCHEVWGVTLADPSTHVPSQIVLQKYLNANGGDLAQAKEQLAKTLDWRAKAKPLDLMQKSFSKDKFGGLGYVTQYTDDKVDEKGAEGKEVFTWNIYGSVKDVQKSFGGLDAFIEWRVALMELAMHELDLAGATKPITDSHDPYKIFQVHDYKSISFFRSPPVVRAAAKKTVEVLAMAYPETLKEKFFINVPAIMGFMYGVMKLFVAPKTIKKFHPMSDGTALAAEFNDSKVGGLGAKLPTEYGGKGQSLVATGKEPKLAG